MFVLALLSICYCAEGTYHATLLLGKTTSLMEPSGDERYVTKNDRLLTPSSTDRPLLVVNQQQPHSVPYITHIPYSPELGDTLRAQSVTESRPIWLRLNGGAQELFACWPERVLKMSNGQWSVFDRSHTLLATGDEKSLWPTLRKGFTASEVDYASPFKGGWMGVFGYGLAAPALPKSRSLPFPDTLLGDYRRFVYIDHDKKSAELVTLSGYSGPLDDPIVEQEKCEAGHSLHDFSLSRRFEALTPYSQYMDDFKRIQGYLQAGDCYQVNYAQAFHARCHGSGAVAMRRLLTLTQATHAAWMLAPEGEVLSLSPELFLSINGGRIVTMPIKGTAPRHPDPATDELNREALRSSTKNRAENLMIVDLLRHDLSRHAKTGSVRVEKLFSVESLPQVHHLVSTVTAQVAEGADAIDVIRDSFPGGSITGAPKKRAIEIIDELEPTPRSVYCGSIGYVGLNGDAELNIAIRTLLRIGEDIYTWAGGGIVADSVAEEEYQECFDKIGALMHALESVT